MLENCINEDVKLKDFIKSEIENVVKMLISPNGDKITLTKWLQSLQKIDNICKERNRY